jgi:hypothetical protein
MHDQTHMYDSLFQRLPVELQAEVFTRCTLPYSRISTKDAPLSLCQVCTSWKNLIQSTPSLWSRFEINVRVFGNINSERHRHFLNTMVLWLKRSTTYTLSIRIIHQPVGCTSDPRFLRLLTMLIPHICRLRDIEVLTPISSITPFQRPLSDDFPSLRSLTLVTSKGQYHSESDLNIPALGIPWCQLTLLHLRLAYNHLLTLDECLDILTESVNLVMCTINADSTFDRGSRRCHKVTLPMLGYFHLILERGGQTNTGSTSIETPQSCLISLLDHLHLTKLHTLTVECLVQDASNEWHWINARPILISKLGYLGTTLKCLTLTYLPLMEQEILDLVRLPNLLQLDLRFSLAEGEHDPISDDFLHACTTSSYSNFLPLLETIHLQCRGDRCTISLVVGLIQSRWTPGNDGGTRLRAFSFISMKPISSDVHQRVGCWNKAGLVVDIDSVSLF